MHKMKPTLITLFWQNDKPQWCCEHRSIRPKYGKYPYYLFSVNGWTNTVTFPTLSQMGPHFIYTLFSGILE